MHIRNFFSKPAFWAVLFGLLLVAWWRGGERLLEDSSASSQAERNLQELKKADPQAAAILARIDDERQQRALQAATYSTSADGRRRSVLADMAAEVAATNGLPYRAQIAALALDQVDLRDEETRSAFLVSHATACESLAIAADWNAVNDYVDRLEQASEDSNVWSMVRDDPLGLVLWDQLKNDPQHDLLSFYHRNRDWLADPLAALDLSGVDGGWTVQTALEKLAKNEKALRKAVEEGELGVYALATTLTHGTLIGQCFDRYQLDPSEVISVIMFNQDVLDEREGDAVWIGEKAAWLAQISQRHSTVWFAAARTPFALRLHRDASHVSDSLLEKYGADDVAGTIYRHFEDSARVAAAASAIDRFGDLAIYVFSRYEDKVFMDRLGDYLIDEKINIRVIPFVIRFGDEAFSRIQDDPDWVDRYFNSDGTPRVDPHEWIQHVPGGAALHVASTWAKGYPCEWSELGWAAVDVADAALAVASFGASKAVTEPAKAVGKGAAKAAGRSAKGARAAAKLEWRKALAAPVSPSRQASRVAEMAKTVASGTAILAKPIWGAVKLSTAPLKIAHQGGQRALNAWKAISPAKKVWIYRGLLGVGLYVTVTNRTLPNVDKISAGIGQNIGQAAAGAITMAGDAIAAALATFADQLTGGNLWVKQSIYWAVIAGLAVLMGWCAFRAVRDRRQVVLVKG